LNATRWTGATAGSGNGVVAGTYADTTANVESRLWWDHLRRAGFVAGTGQQQPYNAVAGIIGVQTGDGITPAATLGGFAGLIVCSANLPDKIAIATDVQVDDGVGTTGTVRGKLQTTANMAIGAAATADTYAENGTNTYVLCRAM
ncbi:MAG: hypothetical protein OEV81_13515, partial [Betaproteobacteria bacterium]|nr:hypothetical protein [Betaproteobacteria bacterium]